MSWIRQAEKKDIDRILELLVQVDMVHHKGRPDLFKGPATKYTAQELEGILADPDSPVFVCVDENDSPIGHAFCVFKKHIDDNVMTDVLTLYIDDICVDEAARGRHVGKALYEYVTDYARDCGCYNITLNVWNCNPTAMRFYKAMGLIPQKLTLEQIL